MTVLIKVDGARATAHGPFKFPMLKLFSRLRGKTKWEGTKEFEFDALKYNLDLIRGAEFEFPGEFSIERVGVDPEEKEKELATQHNAVKFPTTQYKPNLPLFKHQSRAVSLSWDREAYALLLEMGLGKTAILITNAGILHMAGKLSGVLVLSPKGVHRQWLEEQVPEHLDKDVKVNSLLWKKQDIDVKEMKKKGLTFLSMNIDAIRTPLGLKVATAFLKLHNGKSMMIVDESHLIKTGSADRTRAAIKLGQLAHYRRISTGTPISKNLMDAWSQFNFLDVGILQHPYMSTFRARYCVMGGFEGRQIVGSKNVEDFYSLIAPHSFRLTKDEALNLPPKMYQKVEYEMGEKTLQHYNSLKKTFMTALDDGDIVDVTSAAVAVLRLQQVVCGYLPIPNFEDTVRENEFEEFSEERLDVLSGIVEQVKGPIIVWCRFRKDITRVEARLNKEYGKGSCVTYYGATKDTKKNDDRNTAVKLFTSNKVRFFVSNPQSGGTGLNLQVGGCQTAIYYSNSFNSIHRWQSEDRLHRMGTKGTVTNIDIVAAKTVDRAILGSLNSKKDLSSLTLDQIRQAISGA